MCKDTKVVEVERPTTICGVIYCNICIVEILCQTSAPHADAAKMVLANIDLIIAGSRQWNNLSMRERERFARVHALVATIGARYAKSVNRSEET